MDVIRSANRIGESAGREERVQHFSSSSRKEEMSSNINAKVPQGPFLGPVLWNAVAYDGVLKLTIPPETTLLYGVSRLRRWN